MLKQENFSEEHIRELQKTSRRDPVLLERSVYAFGLLEALVRVGMPFVFKGGSCLLLLMEHPRRLSTDIDIIVEPETDLDAYIAKAAEIFPFTGMEEQKRVGRNNIVKRHFKFIYDSPINADRFYILLDVLFEDNHYSELVEREIRNDLLLTEPDYLKVTIPSANCILADKLTAFAPHTTGIPLYIGKNMEIMKQFFDVSMLIDIFTDYQEIGLTYELVSGSEAAYRGISASYKDCLWDTLETALCIASRGKVNSEEYPLYVDGIHKISGHIYRGKFSPEDAVADAAKIIYMAACLLSDTEYRHLENVEQYREMKITQEKLMPLRYLRKANPEAYAYIIKADNALSKFMGK